MKLHAIAGATAMTMVLAQSQPDAQARPDFSGSWVLSAGTGPGRTCGKSMTVTQDAGTLTLGSSRAVTYKFDGSDTTETFPPPPPRPPDASPTEWIGHATGSVSRAAWNGDQFVIVTHSTMRMTMPRMVPDPFDRVNTSRQTLSLNADGGLRMDVVSITDPLPGGTPRRLDPPWSWTCTYKRAGRAGSVKD